MTDPESYNIFLCYVYLVSQVRRSDAFGHDVIYEAKYPSGGRIWLAGVSETSRDVFKRH